MKKQLFLALLILIMFVATQQTIIAMPKVYDSPQPSFNIYPYNNKSIDVINEELEYVISDKETEQNQVSYINQDYKLKNTSKNREEILVALIMIGHVNLNDIEVTFNGKKQDLTRENLNRVSYIGNGFTIFDEENREKILGINFEFDDIVHLVNNQLNKSGKTIQLESGEVDLLFVKLPFESNSINSLHISHKAISGFMKKRSGTIINYTYEHLIEPAKYWNSFNDLDVTIRIPSNFNLLSLEEGSLLSNIDNVEDGVYKKHFSSLPSGKISFSIRSISHDDNTDMTTTYLVIASIAVAFMLSVKVVHWRIKKAK